MSNSANDLAVIGMACRFPGAPDLDAYWHNLRAGIESVKFFTDEELAQAGVAPEVLNDPRYVKARAVLDDIELFDANFFNVSPREAEVLDVQHRLFLECAWHALEHAAQDAAGQAVGVFAGAGFNSYLLRNLYPAQAQLAVSPYQVMLANDKDYLATRVAYKLNLTGPSVSVQTACSTSLVAIHMACQSLLNGECDLALAGGVTIAVPQTSGYLYEDGMIFSPDGHCRPFDARGGGIVGGNGVGVVALKRLDDALANGDTIHAVVKSSAMNNDGADKMGYTAPSVSGQAAVIAEALALANLEPRDITYVEAHGTATPLGDPIEVAALTKVYGQSDAPWCALGSVKSNFGHLDAAAGVAGFIKTVLALMHRELLPSLNFETPNPEIDFERSPFFVNGHLRAWEATAPRRAGVSSFGIGGTNAHVILEEAPATPSTTPSTTSQLLLVSARTPTAARRAAEDLADFIEGHPTHLADAAYTLAVGRHAHEHRLAVLNPAALRQAKPIAAQSSPSIAFLFSGQGAQYSGMARELYQAEPIFRAALDECAELLCPHLDRPLLEVLWHDAEALSQTRYTQPALFAVEYALAQLWQSWGVTPTLMLGHSLGEYVAACLAGVFTLADALRVVAARGRLMQAMSPGAMLAVVLSEADVAPYLSEAVALASVNAPQACVLAGPFAAMEQVQAQLEKSDVRATRLRTSHAFHSSMLDPLLPEFIALLRGLTLNAPRLPFVSNVTGQLITATQATDPAYWVQHARQTVRFAAGVQTLAGHGVRLALEVGPGNTLTNLSRQAWPNGEGVFLNSFSASDEVTQLKQALGQLWAHGAAINWERVYPEPRCRIPLPLYPFERQRYWIEPTTAAPSIQNDVTDWFYLPTWTRSLPRHWEPESLRDTHWLIFADESKLSHTLLTHLRAAGASAALVLADGSFAAVSDHLYTVHPTTKADYAELMRSRSVRPTHILHAWALTPLKSLTAKVLENAQNLGLMSLLALAQTLGESGDPVALTILTHSAQSVTGAENINPPHGGLVGLSLVLRQELANLQIACVDLDSPHMAPEKILAECVAPTDLSVAYRHNLRWLPSYTPTPLPRPTPSRLRAKGVYLITGGLGGLGLVLADYIARHAPGARLVLLSRSAEEARHALALEKLRQLGAQVLPLTADVTDEASVHAALTHARETFGGFNGVIHAAAFTQGGLLQLKDPAAFAAELAPKLYGTWYLAQLLTEPLDFFMLFSSLTALTGGVGQGAYAAANTLLDALAHTLHRPGRPCLAVNWARWQGVGLAQEAEALHQRLTGEALAGGMATDKALEAFARALSVDLPQLLIAPYAVTPMVRAAQVFQLNAFDAELSALPSATHSRPNLRTTYLEPRTPTETALAQIWQEVLGVAPIGALDSFTDLGGDSLLAIKLIARVRDALNVELKVRALYDDASLAASAERIDNLHWLAQPALAVAGEVEGSL